MESNCVGLKFLNCVISGVTTLLDPLTSAILGTAVKEALELAIPTLGKTLLEPVLRLLGVELGYADVRLIDLDTSAPQLLL
ncbi:hypothetical protein D9M70_618270 [compost metagenome]